MKKVMPITTCLIFALLLSACIPFTQSFEPFYTEGSVVKLPAIEGKWLAKDSDKKDAESLPKPWFFGDKKINTYNDEGVSSVLNVKYFKIKDMTFADLSPSEPGKGKAPNEFWLIHVIPVHSVCKVELSKNTLKLTPLNGEWVKDMLKKKKLSLTYVDVDEAFNEIVLTSPPKDLEAFLKKYGKSTVAFPKEAALYFQRVQKEEEKVPEKPVAEGGK